MTCEIGGLLGAQGVQQSKPFMEMKIHIFAYYTKWNKL